MWDEDAGKKVTYDCTYIGSLDFEIQGHPELLTGGGAQLSLTRQYDEENSVPEPIFVAELEGAITYNDAKDSITSATLGLLVTKDGEEETEYFHINGTLTVSGTGKVLVEFTDEGFEYTATAGAVVETTWEETLVAWIFQLDVEQESASVQIKDYEIPENILTMLKDMDIVESSVAELTVGELLEQGLGINVSGENTIRTHYEKTEEEQGTIERELFWIGLNDTAADHNRLIFEFKREKDTEKATYVRCCIDIEGTDEHPMDEGLALRLDTWTTDWQGDYAGDVEPLRTQEGYPGSAEVLDASNIAEIVTGLMEKLAPVMQLFM